MKGQLNENECELKVTGKAVVIDHLAQFNHLCDQLTYQMKELEDALNKLTTL